MSKYILMVFTILFLAACKPEANEDYTKSFTNICIDGVQYWYARRADAGYLAPRINPETHNYINCEAGHD